MCAAPCPAGLRRRRHEDCRLSTLADVGSTASPSRTADRSVGLWLLACSGMVFVMIVIGALTRLTESGLSIVEWQPLIGAIPPLGTADWQELFDKYRQFPEYQKLRAGMTLDEFKAIFWLEYIHRLWGRLIGLTFALPALYFLLKGRLRGSLRWQVAALFVLGGAQGALGWYMVKSGLISDPRVSPYRLTAHLGLALVVYGWLFYLALIRLRPDDGWPAAAGGATAGAARLRKLAHLLAAFVAVTILSGGFVAGLDAGLVYNTFPLMDGRFVPEGYGQISPWWRNLFENVAAVQFNHRWLAVATAVALIAYALRALREPLPEGTRLAVRGLLVMAVIQPTLGIATLLTVVSIPIAALHQAGAVALLSFLLWTIRATKMRPDPRALTPNGGAR